MFCNYRLLFFALTSILNLFTLEIQAKEKILVGLAHFPPFIENQGDQVGGLAMKMLDLINNHQEEFEFEAFPTLPTTRHQLFELGRYDMSMFDSIEWGWRGLNVDESKEYLKGGEVYIALNKPGRSQSFFSDFETKTMIGILGYHYGFANFNSDPEFLRNKYNMHLTKSNLGSIQMILAGNRGDIGVVTKSFLYRFLNQYPENQEKLLISDKVDQTYSHRIILRRNLKLTIEKINEWLAELEANGKLPLLWESITTLPLESAPDSSLSTSLSTH